MAILHEGHKASFCPTTDCPGNVDPSRGKTQSKGTFRRQPVNLAFK